MTNWKLNIGDIIDDGRRHLTITGHEIRYMSSWKKPCNEKWCRYSCNICGWEDGWIPEKSLMEGKGCSCCKGRTVVKGINDISTRASHVMKYLVNQDDAYNHTPSSSAIIKTRCPICKEIRDYRISQLTSAPYVCRRCGKNTSIYERVFYELLKIYNIDFIPQLSSANMEWCKNYRYDFYFPTINTIMELNGDQHYKEGFYNRSFKDICQRDMDKMMLAFDNGIETYCIISFMRSTKKQMLEKIYQHSIIDSLGIPRDGLMDRLELCYQKAQEKRIIDICNFYNQHSELSAAKIGKVFDVSSTTVLHALWDGTKFGLCNYDGQKKLKETQVANNLKISKAIQIISPNGDFNKFNSIREASRMSNSKYGIHFSRYFIKKCCENHELFNGYSFSYL